MWPRTLSGGRIGEPLATLLVFFAFRTVEWNFSKTCAISISCFHSDFLLNYLLSKNNSININMQYNNIILLLKLHFWCIRFIYLPLLCIAAHSNDQYVYIYIAISYSNTHVHIYIYIIFYPPLPIHPLQCMRSVGVSIHSCMTVPICHTIPSHI